MATNVIMPVLGMSQDTGKIIRWLKSAGETVNKGEILIEVETDKAVQELEAPASGILGQILAEDGEDVPVTQVIGIILTPEEYKSVPRADKAEVLQPAINQTIARNGNHPAQVAITASPLAARMAVENNLDLAQIKPGGGRVEKADVLAYLAGHPESMPPDQHYGRVLASPKARRFARENNQDLKTVPGSGPEGAVLAIDVERSLAKASEFLPLLPTADTVVSTPKAPEASPLSPPIVTSTIWRRMAEHTSNSWIAAPHFHLQRIARVGRLLAWHDHLQQNSQEKITITDLLVLITSRALSKHPRINVFWQDGKIEIVNEINIGIAVALDDGLIVPVIHQADRLSAIEIAEKRKELVTRAQNGKTRPEEISGGTFTISNLGMYGVDSFNAVLNGPQAAILAVGRIIEQVIPVNGVPAIQPVLNLSVAFDHRAVDGARGAKFLETLTEMVEEPLMLVS